MDQFQEWSMQVTGWSPSFHKDSYRSQVCWISPSPPKGLPLRPLACPHTPAQVWKVPTESIPGSSWKLASHSEVKVAQLLAPHSHLTPCKVAQLACPRYCSRSSCIFHFIFSRHLKNLTIIISILGSWESEKESLCPLLNLQSRYQEQHQ